MPSSFVAAVAEHNNFISFSISISITILHIMILFNKEKFLGVSINSLKSTVNTHLKIGLMTFERVEKRKGKNEK